MSLFSYWLRVCMYFPVIFSVDTRANWMYRRPFYGGLDLIKSYLPHVSIDFLAITSRSSHWRCSVKKVFLEILQNSQENIYARAYFLIKLQACFPVNFAKYLRTPFLTEYLRWLLLKFLAVERMAWTVFLLNNLE